MNIIYKNSALNLIEMCKDEKNTNFDYPIDQIQSLKRTIQSVDAICDSEEVKKKIIFETALSIIAKNDYRNKTDFPINKVFKSEFDNKELAPIELSDIAGINFQEIDFTIGHDKCRLNGNLCHCNGNGEFVLLPNNEEGQKTYMQCRYCGGVSHL